MGPGTLFFQQYQLLRTIQKGLLIMVEKYGVSALGKYKSYHTLMNWARKTCKVFGQVLWFIKCS